MSPAVLDRVLSKLRPQEDPRLIVGFEYKDDAGVYLLKDGLALVQTVDFFTPIVDDPYQYGQIAAANSLSDVYAMGGLPLTALSIVCYPENGDLDVLDRMLSGGLDKMIEAGCTIVGGHTVRDAEIKFGYAVTGTVNPLRIWKNSGAHPGDVLYLTKPLGTGVIATALRAGKAESAWVDGAVRIMSQLNRDAAAALGSLGQVVHSATDVTGFGLIGHAWEMASGACVSLRVNSDQIGLLDGALECARGGFLAGGLKNNREFLAGCVSFSPDVTPEIQNLLYDPQTSGGLLIAADAAGADDVYAALTRADCPAMRIGEVLAKRSPLIEVL